MKNFIAAVNSGLDKAAVFITEKVGTVWCAILFTCLSLVSLPGALASHDALVIVGWVAQTFLQLVLLPIIMVGQNVASAKTEQTILDIHRVSLNMQREMHKNHSKDIKEIHRLVKSLQPSED